MISKEKYSKKLIKEIGKTINQYGLISAEDTVLVGISGGKDSLALLDMLVRRKQYLPIDYSLIAAYVSINTLGHKIDIAALEKFCATRNVPFICKHISVDLERDSKKDKCFICSWHRRKVLFDLCQQLKCNKLALGHHMDDILTTLLMNMSMQGNISTMPVKMSLFGGDVTIVRPLAKIEEKEILSYVELNQLHVQKDECPYGDDQTRVTIRNILEQLSKMNIHVKRNMFRSMSHIRTEYLS